MRFNRLIRFKSFSTYFFVFIFFAIGIHHLTKVSEYGVDVPYWDEWEYTNPDQLPGGLSLEWLYQQHNEHRISLTRVQTYLFYKLNSWDIASQQIVNFVTYFFALFLFSLALGKWSNQARFWKILCLCSFLLSPRLVENHLWGFQSQFHFSWMFSFAAAYFWFRETNSLKLSIFGGVAAALAIYSFSGGVLSSLWIMCAFTGFTAYKLCISPAEKKKIFLSYVVGIAPALVAILLWFYGYEKHPGHGDVAMPWSLSFWAFFTNLISSGWGLGTIKLKYSILFTTITVTPLLILFFNQKYRRQSGVWAIIACAGAALAFLAVISAGRAGFLPVGVSKTSRYAEIGGLLIPLCGAAYLILFENRPRLNAFATAALILTCYLGFRNDWNYERTYGPVRESRLAGLACLREYYFNHGGSYCKDLYPIAIPEKLESAKKLQLSFYKKLSENRPGSSN